MTNQRRLQARRVREDAAALAADRNHPPHRANGDEQRYASAHYPLSFTKGLHHDPCTGLVKDPGDFEAFRAAIDNGFVDDFTRRVPVPRDRKRRKWEAPTAGLVYDLQGPDAQAVTMAPAPALCSDELTFEMAEVYELALLRDVPLNRFDRAGGSADLTEAVARLNALKYATDGFGGRPRKTGSNGQLDRQTAFRGSSPGVEAGPYLSQFMIIGTGDPADGRIDFGAQQINQRVPEAKDGDDYMMSWDAWREVQQGYEVRGGDPCGAKDPGQSFEDRRRFIYTPRDLATYVHVDALYQAYLNACLILLGNETPFDPGFGGLSGAAGDMLANPADGAHVELNAGGFALWGGPHILSLMTEVATRALKAVRYQKFNNHLRLRPEALAARIEKAEVIETRFPELAGCFTGMRDELSTSDETGVLDKVRAYNAGHSRGGSATALLPMAFKEGSPMHPTYGAGHATVAGACVTMLKAFFDTSAVFVRITSVRDGETTTRARFLGRGQIEDAVRAGCTVEAGSYEVMSTGPEFTACGRYVALANGDVELGPAPDGDDGTACPLTLEGELNKLAANISIARNMAGVHYFSDYYDSLRMGEAVALGILEEQALCYPTDPCVMSVPTFDGDVVRVGRR